MKGVFVFKSSDIAFMWSDESLKQHFTQLAGCQDQNAVATDGELDQALRYLQPFIVSQRALNSRSCVGTNGVRFTFLQFDDHIYLCISDDETEAYQRHKLSALHRIITCLMGPVLDEIKPNSNISARKERWNTIGKLLETWCNLYDSEQGFLVEAIERLHVSPDLIGQCMKFLDSTVHQMRAVDRDIVHALLIVENKLACYKNIVDGTLIDMADIQMLILLANSWFSDINDERLQSQKSVNSTTSSGQYLDCQSRPTTGFDHTPPHHVENPNATCELENVRQHVESQNAIVEVHAPPRSSVITELGQASQQYVKSTNANIEIEYTQQQHIETPNATTELEHTPSKHGVVSQNSTNELEHAPPDCVVFPNAECLQSELSDQLTDLKSPQLQRTNITITGTSADASSSTENVPCEDSTKTANCDIVPETQGNNAQGIDGLNVQSLESLEILPVNIPHESSRDLDSPTLVSTEAENRVSVHVDTQKRLDGEVSGDKNPDIDVENREKLNENLNQELDSSYELRIQSSGNSCESDFAECSSGKSDNNSLNCNSAIIDNGESEINSNDQKNALSLLTENENNASSGKETCNSLHRRSVVVSRSLSEFSNTLKSKPSVIRIPERVDSNTNNNGLKIEPVHFHGRSFGVPRKLNAPRIETDLVNGSTLKRNIVGHQVAGRSYSVASEEPPSTDEDSSRRNTPSTMESSGDDDIDWVILNDIELRYRKIVMFLKQSILEKKAKHQQKQQKYMVPHNLQCVHIMPGVELILISQIPDVKHSKALLQLIDFCERLYSVNKAEALTNLMRRMESCVKKLADFGMYGETATGHLENVKKHWCEMKKLEQNGEVLTVNTESGATGLSNRLEPAVNLLRTSIMNLFTLLFYRSRGQTLDRKRAVLKQIDTIRRYLHLSLTPLHAPFTCVARHSPFSSYRHNERFQGLLHFIFIDRQSGCVLAPPFNVQSDDGHIDKDQLRLKKQVWQLMELMQINLSQGYSASAQRMGGYYVTYSLWFEDFMGNSLTPEVTPVKNTSVIKSQGFPVIDHNFYKRLVDESFPSKSHVVCCYEMLCIFDSSLKTSDISDQCLHLSKELRDQVELLSPRITIF